MDVPCRSKVMTSKNLEPHLQKKKLVLKSALKTRRMHDIVGQSWSSACIEHGAVKCIWLHVLRMWLNLRPQNITKRTHMYTNCESGLTTIYKTCCTQVGPAHTISGDGMDRSQHSSHLLPRQKGLESSDFNTGTVSQATKTNGIDRLPCSYLYCSSHSIGKSMSSLHPCI